MAKAIQIHGKELVDNMPFLHSELPDFLVAEECLTEDECKSLRKIHQRKDQLRCLLRLLKGRNFETMMKFLEQVKIHRKNDYESIMKTYDDLLQKPQVRECSSCKVKRDVDIKYVVDHLWPKGVISDPLCEKISRCTKHAGDQEKLWNETLRACQQNNGIDHLCDALSIKKHYSHLAKGLRSDQNTHMSIIECTCTNKSAFRPSFQGYNNTTCRPEISFSEGEARDADDEYDTREDFSNITDVKYVCNNNTYDPPKSLNQIHEDTNSDKSVGNRPWYKRFIFVCKPILPEQ